MDPITVALARFLLRESSVRTSLRAPSKGFELAAEESFRGAIRLMERVYQGKTAGFGHMSACAAGVDFRRESVRSPALTPNG